MSVEASQRPDDGLQPIPLVVSERESPPTARALDQGPEPAALARSAVRPGRTGNGTADDSEHRKQSVDGARPSDEADDHLWHPEPAPRDKARALADDAIVAPPRPPPRSGWRRTVVTASGGRLHPGLSPAEVARRRREERIRAPIDGCRRVAVVSRKGGVGKSTITALAGATLAALRGDRVVAVDCNPDAGTLAYRVARDHHRTITDLLDAWPDSVDRYQDVRRYTSQDHESRLEVVASDVDPRVTGSLAADDYRQAIAGLERHFTLIMIDTGTDIRHAAARTALDVADQLVVVVAPSLDGARAAAQTLDWLHEHDHSDLVGGAVAVLNGVGRQRGVDLRAIDGHFASRCRVTVTVPWDPVLEAGGRASLGVIRRPTRNAFLDMAAALADGFPTPGEGGPS